LIKIGEIAPANSTLFTKGSFISIERKNKKGVVILRNEKHAARLDRLKLTLKSFQKEEKKLERPLAEKSQLQAQDMKLSWNEESKTHRALNLTKN
jgi:hypothetical protein